jgi:signal transduction histidine kinase
MDTTIPLVELFNASRVKLLSSANDGTTININRDSILPVGIADTSFGDVGKLYPVGKAIYFPITVAVVDKKQVLGYLVKWRRLVTTRQSIEQFSQLIGAKGSLYFGNDDESFWTDGLIPIPSPPVDKKNIQDIIMYKDPGGEPVMASAQHVANTRWLLLIALSRQTISETAKRFFLWLIIVGGALLCGGIFLAWLMSRNITRPLKKMTVATSIIAAGDYSAAVEVGRRDELGKLARSFNAMAVQVSHAQQNMEKKVQERTAQLEKANKELEAFSYSVSHDLRAPLRAISGFSTILKEDYAGKLDEEASRLTDKIISNAKMMGQLIDDLIAFSRIERKEVKHQPVDMEKLAVSCVNELLHHDLEKKYRLHIHPLPACYGDESLMKQVWMNLIGNAVKYSSKKVDPFIEIGSQQGPGIHRYFIRDNGVGFDMQYAHKLFGVFQRLHNQAEFEGTGVGLALAKRIINHHNGDIWAEASPGKGATFYFSLPENNSV